MEADGERLSDEEVVNFSMVLLTSGIHVSLVIMVFRVSVRGKMPLTWDNVDCRDLHEPQEGTPFR